MDVIYGLIPFVLAFGFIAVVAFIWMAKKGQFDDLDGVANRILFDDDEEPTNAGMKARDEARQQEKGQPLQKSEAPEKRSSAD
ncbi:cbb3-type cytochrome oxidase assembly protein CcoS [Sulfurivirga sp.]|uniref:cbb3-type cytochrome oxidase assembly protein CcoS n=1 Tax=Sulfurivirga sp. TaxID=2614236 RepID=UPI0025DF4771|nr:cbb3-type cytochrome oxidase assembly protein CcoS [Sulfurivirga sp.]